MATNLTQQAAPMLPTFGPPPPEKWVQPEIYRIITTLPVTSWPFNLFRPDGLEVWFNSPEEIYTVTMPVCPECGERLEKIPLPAADGWRGGRG